MRRLFSIAALVLMAMPAMPDNSFAQRLGPHVARPRLREVTDTNDARMYLDAGIALFARDAETASAAFYWAARIDPSLADAIYGRRAALLARDRTLLNNVMSGDPTRMRSPAAKRLDSLQFRALMFNPFLFRRLDTHLFVYYLTDGRGIMDAETTFELNAWIMRASPIVRAWYAYGEGHFDAALVRYAEAARRTDDKAGIRLERARIFGMRNLVDSAVAEFKVALNDLRKRDEKDLVAFYNSKAQTEFSIGVLLEGDDRKQEAREAYGRALQEDLAYYPAHLKLGLLALSTGDTSTALSELALAAQIATDEPWVRYMNGFVLGAANKHADAIAELQKATELEPFFAQPHILIGGQYERLGKGPEAMAAYKRYMALSSGRSPHRQYVTGRMAELDEILAAGAPPK